jgi:ABC-2 type transport system ATP-binding protein
MEEAEYCHRLALINRGRLVAIDTPAGLKERMTGALLLVAVPNAPAAMEALAGRPDILEAAMFGRSLHVAVSDVPTGSRAVTAALGEAGIQPSSVEPVEPSLEDVFVALVRRGEAEAAA